MKISLFARLIISLVLIYFALQSVAMFANTSTLQLSWSTDSLSTPRRRLASAAAGTKILFAGGFYSNVTPYPSDNARDTVDIYDTQTNTWSTATLSQPRGHLAATAVDNKVLFGGGFSGSFTGRGESAVVDIYDTETDTWTVATLSQARGELAAASAGGKAAFAGGLFEASPYLSDVVDIYDAATATWSTANLSVPRSQLTAAGTGTKILFAGGYGAGGYGDVSSRVDIYDTETGEWTTAELSLPKRDSTAVAVGNKILFAGGVGPGGNTPSNVVDIYDTETGVWTTSSLSQPRWSMAGTAFAGKAFFAGGYNIFTDSLVTDVDIYDPIDNDWSIMHLSEPRDELAAAAVQDAALFAGGHDLTSTKATVDLVMLLEDDGLPGKIVYMADQILYLIDPDGGNRVQLTGALPNRGSYPKFSPDGSRIAFEGFNDGDPSVHLWIMNHDGSGAMQLSTLPVTHPTLVWSPTGDRILFMSGSEAYTVKTDGTELTHIPGWPAYLKPSSWSPDGQCILADSFINQQGLVWVVAPDGSNPVLLSAETGKGEGQAQYSPDGTRIVLNAHAPNAADPFDGDIWVMDADGSNRVRLTTVPGDNESIYPRWSPDGTKIVFSSNRDATTWHLWTMNADGSAQVNITQGAGAQWSSWGHYPPLAELPPVAHFRPTIDSLNPNSLVAGGPAFTLIVHGAHFAPDSQVRWNGNDRPTTYVSDTHLEVQIGAEDIAAVGTASITVITPGLGGCDSEQFTIVAAPPNQLPTASTGGPYSVPEGDSISLAGSGSDPDGDPLTFAWDLNNNGSFETPGQNPTFSAAGRDGPDHQLVVLQVCDDNNACDPDDTVIQITNVPPSVGTIHGPLDPVLVNTTVHVEADFADPGVPDTHTAKWEWGDGSKCDTAIADTDCSVTQGAGFGTAAGHHIYSVPGVYTITLIVSDDDGGSDEAVSEVTVIQPPVVLVIDEDSIDNGNAPNNFSSLAVNDNISRIGLRTQLAYFASHVGSTITLYTGHVGDEGWFAVKTIPNSWATAGPTSDGLRNYLGNPSQAFPHNVGKGLGAGKNREALLDKIPGVTPLRATGLSMLKGKRVCAVVYDSDVSINYGPLNGSLKAENLGTVAFEVLTVTARTDGSSSSLPRVEVKIIDAAAVCEGALTLFSDAPTPISSSEPFDVGVSGAAAAGPLDPPMNLYLPTLANE